MSSAESCQLLVAGFQKRSQPAYQRMVRDDAELRHEPALRGLENPAIRALAKYVTVRVRTRLRGPLQLPGRARPDGIVFADAAGNAIAQNRLHQQLPRTDRGVLLVVSDLGA